MSALPIKVLYVLDWFPNTQAGGTETQFWRLLQALDRSIVKPKIIVLIPSPRLESHVPAEELEVLDVQRLRDPRSLLRVLQAIRRARRAGFTILHTYFNDSSMLFPVPFRLSGGRVVVSRRDLGFWYTPGNLRILRTLSAAVDRVVCNSQAVARTAIAQERHASGKIRVIYNALGPCAGDRGAAAYRDQLGIAATAPVITVVANLRPIKRLHDLIEALARVRQALPAACLIVIGGIHPGEHAGYADELHELTRKLGLEKAVFFPGMARDAGDAICASDVCVLPSESEGLANVLLEYAQYGRPSVCTDAGGNPEVVLDGVTGFLYPVGDVAALAERLLQLLADPDRAREMGRAARQHVERHFPVAECVRHHVELYRELHASRG